MTDLDKHHRMANAIRFLAMDAVEKAKSGHPGLPMGAADIATVLFTQVLKFDPTAPHWADRDRFVLSAGHGSMLLYSVLYLLGYEDFSLDQLKNFRQIGARTAGHPEFGHGAGIETTTGPLGQGLANAVGMAIAEKLQAARFGEALVDHYTYVLAGDGCLMEGISQEALTLAGHLKLNKLIVIWDDNGISIDGKIDVTDSTDQIARFEASQWNTIRVDGHDPVALAAAFRKAQESERPTLIAAKTVIGFGSPTKAGTAKVHGSPLGADEIAATRKALNWPHEPFEIPSDVLDAWRIAGLRSAHAHKDWEKRFAAADAETRAEFERRNRGDLPAALKPALAAYKQKLAEERPTLATRQASEHVLNVINEVVPETIGGSADLTGSNNTKTAQTKPVTPDDFSGRYIHWGIREHGMAAAMNGMALHGGMIPYSGTFLVFADYCRPSLRLAALMEQRVIHVMTHDSIGLGEDGPTHQPVEHYASLRAIPNLHFFRPADVTETLECWQLALGAKKTPSVLALTRQGLAAQRKTYVEENLCARGAYVLADTDETADVTIFASGSEVEIAMDARAKLEAEGVSARVVSVPCFELFEAQSADYQADVIGTSKVRIAVETGIRMGWDRFIGTDGVFIGMSGFGASGPYKELYAHFGITADAVVAAAKKRLA
ncbi:transketolase [Microvirga tunisiensis]|uniref:Transketolase n=2 Tax=Pannonibacter tanglangensis TaxID=2750084 RepID=A0A7X5JAU5_9HYPH|nr:MULTISPECIES: transketolase [unclassified Pannonibacter]NBN65253.1 transketolase [Pannonibacter sp. XCT-34]NBN79770.1 transketolase [Pannonibacter sp. XCT-53]